MRSIAIGFGLLVLALLALFRLGEIQVVRSDARLEVVVAVAAVLFFFIGIYFNRQVFQKPLAPSAPEPPAPAPLPAAPVVETSDGIDYAELRKTGLTDREHEVLQKLAEGLSNAEIAAALFLSESTVKTHVSNILFKLDVKRRTAAVQVAKRLRIIV